jgi:hypothetical protein
MGAEMSIEAMKQALEALELLRLGLIQMRKHSEEYGRAWAGAYVEEYQKLLSGSALEQFKILNALQDRLADVDEAVVDGYQAIASLRLAIAEAERQEPVGTLNIWRVKGHLVNHDFDYSGDLPDGTYSVYLCPPKREWVRLTDLEIDQIYCDCHDDNGYPISLGKYERALEAKLREKNGC